MNPLRFAQRRWSGNADRALRRRSAEDTAGRFAQVSGMTCRYAASKPAGSRIVAVGVGGKPLEMGRIYKLATNDFIFGGGDGHAALTSGKPIIDPSAGTLMATTVMDHIAQQGEIAPQDRGPHHQAELSLRS
jgi:2',3'-cyclic-nucleotide 2'-phosphodiesterase (5'-nucleotidase family)